MATFWELVGQLAVALTMGTSKAAGALFLLRILTTTWSVILDNSIFSSFYATCLRWSKLLTPMLSIGKK